MSFNVLEGSLIQTPFTVDAIATLINLSGFWAGQIDGVIMDSGGQFFYEKPDVLRSNQGGKLRDGQIITSFGENKPHNGNYKNIIFCADDLIKPLNQLVFSILTEAHRQGFQSIALPLMRTGNQLGRVEKTLAETVRQMKLGEQQFRMSNTSSNLKVYVVVYNNPTAIKLFSVN